MSRFIEATDDAVSIMQNTVQQFFPDLNGAVIKFLFDTKKRTTANKLTLGRVIKANDIVRKLTDNLSEDGCDYIICIDNVAFENIPEKDQVRLIRHELRHCKKIGDEQEKSVKFIVVPHDIEDFVEEIKLNKDDVDWAKRVASLTEDIYDQMEEDEKSKK